MAVLEVATNNSFIQGRQEMTITSPMGLRTLPGHGSVPDAIITERVPVDNNRLLALSISCPNHCE